MRMLFLLQQAKLLRMWDFKLLTWPKLRGMQECKMNKRLNSSYFAYVCILIKKMSTFSFDTNISLFIYTPNKILKTLQFDRQ
jgi:hypothetical protein